jgi:hypothetical protein
MDVINLSVQHGAASVLRHFDVQGLEPAPGGPAHNAHDAAGPDIQGKDQILLLGSQILHHATLLFLPLHNRFSSASTIEAQMMPESGTEPLSGIMAGNSTASAGWREWSCVHSMSMTARVLLWPAEQPLSTC